MGVPTRKDGRSRQGVDCLGLILCVYQEVGADLGPFLSRARQQDKDRMEHLSDGRFVSVTDRRPGDVMIMQSLKASEPHHFGLYTGSSVIHAHSKYGKVIEQALDVNMELRIVDQARYCGRM